MNCPVKMPAQANQHYFTEEKPEQQWGGEWRGAVLEVGAGIQCQAFYIKEKSGFDDCGLIIGVTNFLSCQWNSEWC